MGLDDIMQRENLVDDDPEAAAFDQIGDIFEIGAGRRETELDEPRAVFPGLFPYGVAVGAGRQPPGPLSCQMGFVPMTTVAFGSAELATRGISPLRTTVSTVRGA
ncbi:hypothetical protein FDG2_6049 [Candidatus Protofrankia californiensis]|uniref:Uncharacterized protein n=1 Tax=Candidatus Protofrankia californiensis TaxID=1839754 RepID=A0A1C3PGD5_9ACTN|nr:hypothetical protein FDG2_6049 [Candidatus Protofrankia californiensis]